MWFKVENLSSHLYKSTVLKSFSKSSELKWHCVRTIRKMEVPSPNPGIVLNQSSRLDLDCKLDTCWHFHQSLKTQHGRGLLKFYRVMALKCYYTKQKYKMCSIISFYAEIYLFYFYFKCDMGLKTKKSDG